MAHRQCARISIAESSKPTNARSTRGWRAAIESNRRRDRSLLIFTFAATVFLFQVRADTAGSAGRLCQPLAIPFCDQVQMFLPRDPVTKRRIVSQSASARL